MKVSLAAQLMSYSVGILMHILIRFGAKGLPPDAAITSDFLLDVDAIFDSMNGAKKRMSTTKRLRGPLHAGSAHLEFWKEIEEKIKKWKVFDKEGHTVTSPTLKSMMWNIAAYRKLLVTLQDQNIEEVFLGECSQDCLENAFGVAKYYASNYHTPSPQDFILGRQRQIC
ncbi:Hypothetical predicted protein [Cloeon dipterum]|nr:Hypothetical predicted protein [Cloeon dipterum]